MPLDEDLVRRLLEAQFPDWARPAHPAGSARRVGQPHLPARRRPPVRLPSAYGYVEAVAKEQRWLPVIAPHVPFRCPSPWHSASPTAEFPRPWSVYRWIVAHPRARRDRRPRWFRAGCRALPVGTGRGRRDRWPRSRAAQLLARRAPPHLRRRRAALAHPRWRGRSTRCRASRVGCRNGHRDRGAGRSGSTATSRTATCSCASGGWRPSSTSAHPASAIPPAIWRSPGPCSTTPLASAFRDGLAWDDEVWARGRAWALWKAMLLLSGAAGSHDPDAEARQSRIVIERILAGAD